MYRFLAAVSLCALALPGPASANQWIIGHFAAIPGVRTVTGPMCGLNPSVGCGADEPVLFKDFESTGSFYGVGVGPGDVAILPDDKAQVGFVNGFIHDLKVDGIYAACIM